MIGGDLLVAPTSTAAEWSVLGHMLADPTLIGEVIGVPLEQSDFSQPDTRLLYATTVQRYYANQPVDALIVGEVAREELAGYWSADPSSVAQLLVRRARDSAVTGTVLEHAAIVKRLSTGRKLQDACYHALRAIGEGQLTPEEIGDALASETAQVTAGSIKRSELLDWTTVGNEYLVALERVRQARMQGLEIGVYTGFPFIDDWTTGIGGGELCFLAGEPGVGKALALDTRLPTPGGWTTMRDVEPGATLIGADGRPCRVTGTSPVMYDHDCYRVVFSDGSCIVADAEHLWETSTRRERSRGEGATLKTTEQIAATLWHRDGATVRRLNHVVAVAEPLALPPADQLVDPYVLGCWLGDGRTDSATLTCVEDELLELIRECEYDVLENEQESAWYIVGLGDDLAELGVLGAKHIPAEYLRGSEAQRAALLGGIIDTDGHVDRRGRVEITLTSERLARDVHELALTLGLKATMNVNRAKLDGHWVGWRFRIGWRSARSFARLARKQIGGELPARRVMWRRRYIKSVVPVPSVPVKCVAVERKMYLAGDAMIPTHNTALAWAAAMGFASRQMQVPPERRVGTLLLSMEMNLYSSTARMVSMLTAIDGTALREGRIDATQLQRITTEWKNRENVPMYFNFASNFRLSQMRALIAEAIRRHNVGFVVIDHFRMLDTDQRHNNANQEDENRVRFLKENIAKDLNVAVMCLAHTVKVGRGQGGESPKPRLSDLRGSGMIAAFADFIAMAWNPGAWLSDDARDELDIPPDEGDMELLWVKNRFGSPATAPYYFMANKMRVTTR